MRSLEVIHETRYRYGALVEHAHHWVRLRPLQDALQRVEQFSLTIDPSPRYRTERRDAHQVREVRFEIDSPHREPIGSRREPGSQTRGCRSALGDRCKHARV